VSANRQMVAMRLSNEAAELLRATVAARRAANIPASQSRLVEVLLRGLVEVEGDDPAAKYQRELLAAYRARQ
jgi:hypothetical protein